MREDRGSTPSQSSAIVAPSSTATSRGQYTLGRLLDTNTSTSENDDKPVARDIAVNRYR